MSQELEQRVREFHSLFNVEEIDEQRMREYLAPDVVYVTLVPAGTIHRGADEILADLKHQYTLYNRCDCQIHFVAVSDRHVLVERVDVATMRATGGEGRVEVMAAFEFDDQGRITAWREYWDAVAAGQRLGITGEQLLAMLKSEV